VRSSFKEFIETNLMVQSEFNLVFWFVSYKIFLLHEKVGPALSLPSSPPSRSLPACLSVRAQRCPWDPRGLEDVRKSARNSGRRLHAGCFSVPGAALASGIRSCRIFLAYPVQSVLCKDQSLADIASKDIMFACLIIRTFQLVF
jgi:hypothetical protein